MDKETFIQILTENEDNNVLLKMLKRGKHSDAELNSLFRHYRNRRCESVINLNQTAIGQLDLFRKDK